MATDLAAQVAREQWELEQAPVVPRGPLVQRCHFCGQLAATATLVETVDKQERYAGECCVPIATVQGGERWIPKSST